MILDFHTHVMPPEMASAPFWQGKCPMTIENVFEAAKAGGIDKTVISNAVHYLRFCKTVQETVDALEYVRQLFEAGARAFLQGSWQRRDLALLFASGDAPPGFEVLRRQRGREWIGQNDSLLHLTDVPEDRVYAAILTSLIGEGSYEVAGARSRRQAESIIDAVIEYARRLMAGGGIRRS